MGVCVSFQLGIGDFGGRGSLDYFDELPRCGKQVMYWIGIRCCYMYDHELNSFICAYTRTGACEFRGAGVRVGADSFSMVSNCICSLVHSHGSGRGGSCSRGNECLDLLRML